MNAFYLSTSRLMYAMAQVNALPQMFAEIDPKHGTPKKSIIFIMIISLFAPWCGREVLGWIVDMTSVGASLAFTYSTAAAMVIAKRHNDTKHFIIGAIGTVFGLFFISLLLLPFMPGFLSTPSLIALGCWSLLGVFFFMKVRKTYLTSMEDMDTMLRNKEREEEERLRNSL